MSKYAGTQTEKNLQAAFAGESQARNKYTYFASKPRKTVLNRLPLFLRQQQTTKKNTLRCGSRN